MTLLCCQPWQGQGRPGAAPGAAPSAAPTHRHSPRWSRRPPATSACSRWAPGPRVHPGCSATCSCLWPWRLQVWMAICVSLPPLVLLAVWTMLVTVPRPLLCAGICASCSCVDRWAGGMGREALLLWAAGASPGVLGFLVGPVSVAGRAFPGPRCAARQEPQPRLPWAEVEGGRSPPLPRALALNLATLPAGDTRPRLGVSVGVGAGSAPCSALDATRQPSTGNHQDWAGWGAAASCSSPRRLPGTCGVGAGAPGHGGCLGTCVMDSWAASWPCRVLGSSLRLHHSWPARPGATCPSRGQVRPE